MDGKPMRCDGKTPNMLAAFTNADAEALGMNVGGSYAAFYCEGEDLAEARRIASAVTGGDYAYVDYLAVGTAVWLESCAAIIEGGELVELDEHEILTCNVIDRRDYGCAPGVIDPKVTALARIFNEMPVKIAEHCVDVQDFALLWGYLTSKGVGVLGPHAAHIARVARALAYEKVATEATEEH